MFALFLAATLASGCASDGPAADFCLIARPITIEDADVVTDTTARQLLEHNETGARLCGWSTP
jgi:hypothetical protein